MSLYVKKERYCLKWKYKIILLFVFIMPIYFGFIHIYDFLAPQKKIQSPYLVVESWISDFALEESLNIFREDQYQHMFITGGPVNEGFYLMNYKSSSDFAKETFLFLGASMDSMTTINRELVWRDRTYHTALALKAYLEENNPEIKSFNLVSLGAHSRRSWLLFKIVMPEYEIGIITIDAKLHDPNRWWTTSKGFRSVFTEAIGYFYVRFFFTPYGV
jgi:hypothetical protein